jgi:flagellar basal body-associated protein FliL
MAEEAKAAPAAKKSGGMGKIIVMLVLVLVSMGGGMALYKFVLGPRLEGDKAAQKEQKAEEEETSDAIPETAIPFDFDEAQAAVQAADPNASTSVLLYKTSMICANEETKALVEKNKQWFVSMLDGLHRNRTKDELNNPEVEKSMLEQAREQANSLLRRLQAKPNPEFKIIQVLHLKFTVFNI